MLYIAVSDAHRHGDECSPKKKICVYDGYSSTGESNFILTHLLVVGEELELISFVVGEHCLHVFLFNELYTEAAHRRPLPTELVQRFTKIYLYLTFLV